MTNTRKELSENAKKTLATMVGLHERHLGKIPTRKVMFHQNYLLEELSTNVKEKVKPSELSRYLTELMNDGYVTLKEGFTRGTSDNGSKVTYYYELNAQKLDEAKQSLWGTK